MPFAATKKRPLSGDRRTRRNGPPSRSTRPPSRYSKFRKDTRCRFCREKLGVDYKNVYMLSKLCTPQMRVMARKRNGNCLKHQKLVKRAIKYARFLSLLPYEGQR